MGLLISLLFCSHTTRSCNIRHIISRLSCQNRSQHEGIEGKLLLQIVSLSDQLSLLTGRQQAVYPTLPVFPKYFTTLP